MRNLLRLAFALALSSACAAQCELQKILASDGADGDQFGAAVAIGPNTAFAGAWRDDNAFGADAGALYVMEKKGPAWVEVAKLFASDAAPGARFGRGIALQDKTVVVGAFLGPAPGGSSAGAAYVFERQGGTWLETQKLSASDGADGAFFGRLVALSDDESRLVASAYHDGAKQGAAYVFDRVGGVWSETQKLVASDGAPGDNFGKSVALDGTTIVVGANLDGTPGGPGEIRSGSAYVFELVGSTWTETAKLVASDAAADDRYGVRIAVRGERVAVSARLADLPGAVDAGAVYVYDRLGGAWTEAAKLTASDALAGDSLGGPVRITDDGATVVVGAFRTDDFGENSGAAYVFEEVGGAWVETAKLVPRDSFALQEFGLSLDLSGDALFLCAWNDGSYGYSAYGGGAVYFYSLAGTGCPTMTSDAYAVSVGAGGTVAFELDPGAAFAGASYVVAGSLSGHDPGFVALGACIPLVYDAYTQALLRNPGVAPLTGGVGLLDGAGQGTVAFSLPSGSDAALVGLVAHHAFAVLDVAGLLHVSDPVSTFLLP